MKRGPSPVFIAAPYPRLPDTRLGVKIFHLRAIRAQPLPIITFDYFFRHQSWDEFDVFPANERMIQLFQCEPHELNDQKEQQDPEDRKRLWRELEWQQLQELSNSPWRLRCKRLPKFCVNINDNYRIGAGNVLEIIPQGKELVNLNSVRWRKTGTRYFSPDAFTSTRFLQRLEALQSKAQILTDTLSRISESLKKNPLMKPGWTSFKGPFGSTEQSRSTEEQSRSTEEQSRSTEEQSRSTKEQSRSTKKQSRSTKEQSRSTEEQSRSTEEQSRSTEQNQLTNPKREHTLPETEIVIDISFDPKTHQPSNIKSTVLPLKYSLQSADRAGTSNRRSRHTVGRRKNRKNIEPLEMEQNAATD